MTSAASAAGELLGRRDLIVVGAGPVGIAALWYARRHGIDAMGVDAGAWPLEPLRGFTPGLVMASTPPEWEIDGLPVDCRHRREVTREDLFSYYARVIAYGRLKIAHEQRVVHLVPAGGEVRIGVQTCDGAGHWIAKRVIVTPWYRRRRLDLAGPGVTVRDSIGERLPNGAEDVVVVGAGISGLEAADYLIRAGARVTLLSRPKHALPADVQSLFDISGSRVIHAVERVSVARRGVVAVVHEGTTTEVPCTLAINCTGQEINHDLLGILREAGLVSEAELRALAPFQQATLLDKREAKLLSAQLPPLSDALWAGRRGVHFAGTLFHVGGVFGAGIPFSIETAKWAVEAMAGVVDPGAPPPSTHLPSWFIEEAERNAAFPARGQRWSDHLAAIVPTPVPTLSRGTKVFEGEGRTGKVGLEVSHETRALSGEAREPFLTTLRDACYEGVSVAELAEALDLDRETLLEGLRTLWFNNGLTWLPPGQER